MRTRLPDSRRYAASLCLPIVVLACVVCGTASASQVSGWWGGDWNCSIDGRPARMKWAAVDDTRTSCDGNVCTSSSGARWAGHFSDNGSRWVALTNARPGDQGGLYFNHADGNRWYLRQPQGGRAVGWTTWNGKRYPLSCWR